MNRPPSLWFPERKLYYRNGSGRGAITRAKSAGAGATAVTFDAFSSTGITTNADPWPSFDHVLGAAANYVLVSVSTEQNVAPTVTFGGVSMNTAAGLTISSNGSAQWVHFFYLLAASLPAPGTRGVVVDGTAVFSGLARCWSLIGAKQIVPDNGSTPGVHNRKHTHASTGTTSSPVTLADVPAGAAILSAHNNNFSAPTVTGADEFVTLSVGSGGGNHGCGAARTLRAFPGSPGTVTHTYSHASSTRMASMLLEFLPEAA